MFETAELGHTVGRKEFEETLPQLRIDLLKAQQELRGRRIPVLIVFAGVDGGGKSETANTLNEWLDPRWITTRAYGLPSDEERERPEFWRYWRDLPAHGGIGIFLRSWYSRPVVERAHAEIDEAEFDQRLERIAAFEKTLIDDGAVILKYWIHLSRDAQKRRFKALEKDELTAWRVTETDWKHWRMFDDFVATAERTIRKTSTGEAPWTIVEGECPRYRHLKVATILRDELERRLAEPAEPPEAAAPAELPGEAARTVLGTLSLSQSLGKKEYKNRLELAQGRLNRLQRRAREELISTILVFEGWDAAGKGGAIRRMVSALEARDYRVIPIAAPTDEERAHHYLWRFWRHLPRGGRVTVFDRSWYGRVLVERVEGFASPEEWKRAYSEVNDFEEQLVDFGMVLVKFWLHLSQEEQLRRFEERRDTPWKSWKLTEDDWRNRDQWGRYEQAVDEMIERTSTRRSRWVLVEANDKRFARVKIIETVCERLEERLAQRLPRVDDEVSEEN